MSATTGKFVFPPTADRSPSPAWSRTWNGPASGSSIPPEPPWRGQPPAPPAIAIPSGFPTANGWLSRQSPSQAVWLRCLPLDGAGADRIPLHQSNNGQVADDVSPDGRQVAYSFADAQTGWNLRLMDLKGGNAPFTFAIVRDFAVLAQFSPDGRFLAYWSDETGKREIYVAPVQDPAARVQVSTGGAGPPRWSRNGNELFYF